MRKLVDLLNSQVKNNGFSDCRHILVCDDWPEDYTDDRLPDAVDVIMIEWQGLRGDSFFDNFLENRVSKDYEELRLKALKFSKNALICGFKKSANNILSSFRFDNVKTVEQINNKIEQIAQKLELEKEEAKAPQITIFEDLIIGLEDLAAQKNRKITIDYDITVAKYEGWLKRLKNV